MFGKNTPQGFLPSEPSIESILSRVMGGDSGWTGLDTATDQQPAIGNDEHRDLLNCYVNLYREPWGKKILEDLFNMTLRAAPLSKDAMDSLEKTALYAAQRNGQNGIVIAILKRITDGLAQNSQPQKRKSKK